MKICRCVFPPGKIIEVDDIFSPVHEACGGTILAKNPDKDSRIAELERALSVAHYQFDAISKELGVPTSDYPANVANAFDIAQQGIKAIKEIKYVLGNG